MSTLKLDKVSKLYNVRGAGQIKALDQVSFTLSSGRITGLVGQSGSGKSTIAKILTQLEQPSSGTITLDGKPVPTSGRGLRDYRRRLRMVFQDPFASLNPYHTIRYHLQRPLLLHRVVPKSEIEREIVNLLERVQLVPKAVIDRRPHELSGGQRQRVAIARALAARPELLVADEPVSMLDVSIRMAVLTLLADLQKEENLGVLYITHDLATARYFSDEIIVLNQGRIVEHGCAEEVILKPKDPYTKELLKASPDPERYFASATANGNLLGGKQK